MEFGGEYLSDVDAAWDSGEYHEIVADLRSAEDEVKSHAGILEALMDTRPGRRHSEALAPHFRAVRQAIEECWRTADTPFGDHTEFDLSDWPRRRTAIVKALRELAAALDRLATALRGLLVQLELCEGRDHRSLPEADHGPPRGRFVRISPCQSNAPPYTPGFHPMARSEAA